MTQGGSKVLDANEDGDSVVGDTNLEICARHPPMGLSTLDLLARSPSEEFVGWQNRVTSAKVKQEMMKLAKTNMAASLHAQQASRPRVHDMTTLGLPKDPPPLGEHGGRHKKNFVHGKTVERRLIAGRLVRATELEDNSLASSVSAPELSRAIGRHLSNLKSSPRREQDTLDLVLKSGCGTKCEEKPETPASEQPKRETSPGEQERMALRRQENQLQAKLLHVTQKLLRKYAYQLDHHRKVPAATNKIHVLAEKWQQQGRQSPEEALSATVDNEQYKLYVESRFSTQTELDFYPRKIEPREPATDKHRRHTMHTKYGNALVRTKCSLRGPF